MKKALLGLVLATGLSFTAQAKTPDDALVVAWQFDDIITLDPAQAFEISTMELIGNAYEKLVTYDNNDVSKILPAVAESWTVSDDNKTFTFKIKSGLKFASGNPVTANDVAYSLQRAVKLDKTPAFILTQFGFTPENVDKLMQATDDATFVMTLPQAYSPSFVLYCLTAGIGSIVDQKLLMTHEKDGDFGNDWLKTNYAGSGSYVINQWKPNEVVIMSKNPNAIHVPKLDKVFLRHIPESSVQRLLLEKGDVDIARNLQAEQLKGLANNDKVKTQRKTKGTVYYLGFNQKNDILKNPKVIEAMKYLVDYQGIAENVLNGQGVAHQTFIPSGFLGEITDKPYSYDLAKGKALLAEAGYPDGFSVNLDVRNKLVRTEMAKSLQKTWGAAGIKVNVIPSSGKQVLTKYRAREHDIFLGTWGADYQDPHSNASTFAYNPDNSDNAKMKSLAWRNAWDPGQLNAQVDAAVKERDTATRAKMYQDIQREALKQSPFIIIAQQQEVSAERKNVEGYQLAPSFDNNFYRDTSK